MLDNELAEAIVFELGRAKGAEGGWGFFLGAGTRQGIDRLAAHLAVCQVNYEDPERYALAMLEGYFVSQLVEGAAAGEAAQRVVEFLFA